MKVLFIAPQTISLVNGGVRRQVLETRRGLIHLGHDVDLLCARDSFDAGAYDVIHAFGASPEMAGMLDLIRGNRAPIVLSPVMFMGAPPALAAVALKVFDLAARIGPTFHTDLQMKRDCCEWADVIAPNTASEGRLIGTAFGMPPGAMHVIPNGVDTRRFLEATPDRFHERFPWRNFVLFVGDLGASRKNIISLLTAWNRHPGLPDLVLIGSLAPSDHSKSILGLIQSTPNAHWIGAMSHDDPMLDAAYAAAATFILPSRFETPGIAAMEAALAGCEIVITAHGGTMEVFQEDARYLRHGTPEDILSTLQSPSPGSSQALRRRLCSDYDWSAVAARTAELYSRLLGAVDA